MHDVLGTFDRQIKILGILQDTSGTEHLCLVGNDIFRNIAHIFQNTLVKIAMAMEAWQPTAVVVCRLASMVYWQSAKVQLLAAEV